VGWLKNIFSKDKEVIPADLSKVGVDMHSHLVPGVDDGSKSTEDSLELIRGLASLGYRKLITTPHIMSDLYPNDGKALKQKADALREVLLKENINVELECSAEYFLDDHFLELLRNGKLEPFSANYILFEMSFMEKSPLLQEAIFELQNAGYIPILAHPERYTYLHRTYDAYQSLVDQGVHLQLNINSVTGHYSPQVAEISEKLLKDDLISFLGSDCHHKGHLVLSESALFNNVLAEYVNDKSKLLNASL